MLSINIFSPRALVTLACALSVSSLTIPAARANNEDKGPGFVKLDFTVTRTNANSTVLKSREEPDAPLENAKSIYNIDIAFGSQQKVVPVVLDTGSSDLWVEDSPSYYDHTQSTTYQDANEQFSISYGTGSASGEYVYDTVGIPNGVSVKHFQFGDVTHNGAPGGTLGILGIGYTGNEASIEAGEPQYPNFPVALKNAGYISKTAYSLYLNDASATEGSIIFGGIDNAKYEGSLKTVPILHPGSLLDIQLDSVTTPDGKTHSADTSALLDSGTTIAYLPSLLLGNIAESIGGFFNPFLGVVTLPPGASTQGDLQFSFSGQEVSVPLSDLISSGSFNIQSTLSTGGQTILGDVILRSAYVVYDLDDNNVQIAQAKYTDASSIVPIN